MLTFSRKTPKSKLWENYSTGWEVGGIIVMIDLTNQCNYDVRYRHIFIRGGDRYFGERMPVFLLDPQRDK